MRRSRLLLLGILAFPGLAAACLYNRLAVTELPKNPRAAYTVQTPVKAHLRDGSVIVYTTGVRVSSDSLIGAGVMYDLTRTHQLPVVRYGMADVVGLEAYSNDVDALASTLMSTVGVILGGAVVGAVLIAIFGSCPTIYADAGAGLELQGESFSMSIAPLFEARDVDRIVVRPDANGHFVVEIRNEALETHYINQVQAVEVRHGQDEVVLPDGFGRLLAVSDVGPLASARDALGTDRRRELAGRDGRAFSTHPAVLDHAADGGALDDYLDITVPRPAADSAAVVLRMRNSLLNTVLLYDELLAARGAQALEWMGGDLGRIGEAAQLGQWYVRRMGMRVSVLDGGTWRSVGRIPDAGPIAWKDVAIVVPVPSGDDSLRIRLAFVADDWRIDQVRVAARVRRPTARLLAPDSLVDAGGRRMDDARASVAAADGRYLITTPSDRFTVHFGAGPADSARTFLLAAQGYYIEWMRPQWLAGRSDGPAPAPDDATVRRALATWQERQQDYERDFNRSRIPVR